MMGKQGGRPREGMHWYRQDVDEDFDPKIMVLSRMYPLAGVGFWRTLRNQVYRSWPKPFVLDDMTWESLRAVMHISRKRFDDMLDTCLSLGLFNRDMFDLCHILTSPRIEKEIREVVSHRRRNRGEGQETPDDSGEESEGLLDNPSETFEESSRKVEQTLRNFFVGDDEGRKKFVKDLGLAPEQTGVVSESKTPAERGAETIAETPQKPDTVPYRTVLPYLTKGVTIAFLDSIRPRFPGIDIDMEWQDCQRWYAESRKTMKRPQSCLLNWLKRAQQKGVNGQGSRHSDGLPGNRVKGAFSDVVPEGD